MLLDAQHVAIAQRLFPFSGQVLAGQQIHIAGPNGAGKSSLLSALAGLQNAEGRIIFDGAPLGTWSGVQLSRRRAWLPQHQQPPAQMPVWHYLVMHDLHPEMNRQHQLLHYTDILQVSDKLQRPLGQLSGGEWQRVRLAAVLLQVCQPEGRLLLLDEPLAGLDIGQQAAFERLLSELTAQGIAVVMSSHDLNHTLHKADRVWLLRPQQPALHGTPREVLTPKNLSALYQVAFRLIELEGQPFLTTLN